MPSNVVVIGLVHNASIVRWMATLETAIRRFAHGAPPMSPPGSLMQTMNKCPLCANPASIDTPEWSGGRILISCANCGEFSTNEITVDELVALREAGSPRIGELQHAIVTADHRWHVTRSPRLGLIVLESREPQPMTKRQKKHRRRTRTTGVSATFAVIHRPGHGPNSTD